MNTPTSLANNQNLTGRDLVSLDRVQAISEFITKTQTGPMTEQWRLDDGGKNTGRPGTVSNHTVLVLLQLLVNEYNSFSDTAAADMVCHRMPEPVLTFLGLDTPGTMTQWIARIRRARIRCFHTFDPYFGGRHKRLTPEEAAAYLELLKADPLHKVKQNRIDQVSDALTLTSVEYLPEDVRNQWDGKLSIDGTAVPVCDNRNATFGNDDEDKAALDYSAWWWGRSGSHGVDIIPGRLDSQRTNEAYKFGYEADLLVWTTNDPTAAQTLPYICPTVRLKKPACKPGDLALDMIRSLATAGYQPTLMGTDQGIAPLSKTEKLRGPLYDMGIDICCSYTKNDRGLQGGYKGLIWVEGHPYCETMPKRLINATILYNDSKISMDMWLALIEEREYYLAKPNGKPNKDGAVQYLHPVDHGQHVCKNSKRADVPKFCRQRSILVPREHMNLKYRQKYRYGTAEWFREYYSARSINEGYNGVVSDTNKEAIEDFRKRPVRGYAATYIAVAMKIVSTNLRTIKAFLQRTPAESAAIERKRIKRRAGTKHERFYEEKAFLAEYLELAGQDPDQPAALE